MKTYCTFKNCSYSCLIVFSLWLWTILACWKTFCCWRNIFWSRSKKKKKKMLLVDPKYSDSSTGYHLSEWKDSTFINNLAHRIETPAWRVILVFINKRTKDWIKPWAVTCRPFQREVCDILWEQLANTVSESIQGRCAELANIVGVQIHQ